ncbi:Chaperone protein DnaJ [Halotydeus destructor]|nr:Chaperone protein DnaJ [Halotydeus destructor]
MHSCRSYAKNNFRVIHLRQSSSRTYAKVSDKKTNFYDVLGLDSKANSGEIKNAYYDLSMAYHPDKNKSEGAVETFQLISEAYETLGNYDKKRNYDRRMFPANQRESRSQETETSRVFREKPRGFYADLGTDDFDYTQFYKRRQSEGVTRVRSVTRMKAEPGFMAEKAVEAYSFEDSFSSSHQTKASDFRIYQNKRQRKATEEQQSRGFSSLLLLATLTGFVMLTVNTVYEPQRMRDDWFDKKES